jgi:6-pyruvoyltetrahydropterin/6-carboxytetrahydropterin synthase
LSVAGGKAPLVQLSRRYHFVASHRLHVDALDADRHREVCGKCNNPYGHGHNYTVQVTFAGHVEAATGMVTNLADLDGFAQRELIEPFDHRNLNTLECFLDVVPTTENLAVEVWRRFAGFPHARLVRVRVEETSNNAFDYFGEGVER